MDFDTEITADSHRTRDGEFDESKAVYADEEQAADSGHTLYSQRGDSSDEVDPRKLLRDPTLSELRWYYRREMGGILVKKPIEDAFKNGFEFRGDQQSEARTLLDKPTYKKRGTYVDAHKMAEIKARRDGFSVLFVGTEDTADGTHVSPLDDSVDVDDVTHVDVLTIDDLSESASVHDEIEDGTDLSSDEYEVRATGIVVNTDVTSRDFHTPVGYVLGGASPQFIHADRCVHYVWNDDVDGDYNDTLRRFSDTRSTLGEWEGDSVLIPSYDLLKGISKGNWALMQTLFRQASHMYEINLPEDADEEDLSSALKVSQNINSKSALVTPDGWNMQQHDSGNEMDPRHFYEPVFDQICANHEMTKSVLFGTQTGTVSGSETDIKNYFNKVERYRSNRGADKIHEYLTLTKQMIDGRTNDEFTFAPPIEWGPLFKVDRETRLNMLQTQAQGISTLITNYVITPDEARELLNQEWADVEYDGLSQQQRDVLDRINLAKVGQGAWAEANDPQPETVAEPESQAGRPEGARQSSGNAETVPE